MKKLLTNLLSVSILGTVGIAIYLGMHWHPIYTVFVFIPLYIATLICLWIFSHNFISYIMELKDLREDREHDTLSYDGRAQLAKSCETHGMNSFLYFIMTVFCGVMSHFPILYTIDYFS